MSMIICRFDIARGYMFRERDDELAFPAAISARSTLPAARPADRRSIFAGHSMSYFCSDDHSGDARFAAIAAARNTDAPP